MVTVASGGAPLVIAGTIVKETMAAVVAAKSAAAGFAAQTAVVSTVCESALAGAVAAEAVGTVAVAETAFAAAAAASMVATTNLWNPVGWALGAIFVGARETAPQTITWDCYKPIIHEAVEKPTEPMLLAALVSHPMVARVGISTKATSADLPDIEIDNVAGELYLLRGVMLPWGAVAYHADRMEELVL